jgi:hypothetical protein
MIRKNSNTWVPNMVCEEVLNGPQCQSCEIFRFEIQSHPQLMPSNSPKLKWTRHTRDQEETALTYYAQLGTPVLTRST